MDEVKFIERKKGPDLESKLQEKCMRHLATRPGWRGFKANDKYTRGISDIVGCFWGFFVAIELKRPESGKEPTGLQQDFLDNIGYCGGYSYWTANYNQFLRILDEIEFDIHRRHPELTIYAKKQSWIPYIPKYQNPKTGKRK